MLRGTPLHDHKEYIMKEKNKERSERQKAYWASAEGRLQKELMALNYKGRTNSKETRKKIQEKVRAWYESEEGQAWCKKRSEEQKGKVVSEETKKKISEARLATLETEEGKAHVARWADSRRGKKLSKAHVAKMLKTRAQNQKSTKKFTLIIKTTEGEVIEEAFDSSTPYRDFITKYGYGHRFKALSEGETITINNKSNKHSYEKGTQLTLSYDKYTTPTK